MRALKIWPLICISDSLAEPINLSIKGSSVVELLEVSKELFICPAMKALSSLKAFCRPFCQAGQHCPF